MCYSPLSVALHFHLLTVPSLHGALAKSRFLTLTVMASSVRLGSGLGLAAFFSPNRSLPSPAIDQIDVLMALRPRPLLSPRAIPPRLLPFSFHLPHLFLSKSVDPLVTAKPHVVSSHCPPYFLIALSCFHPVSPRSSLYADPLLLSKSTDPYCMRIKGLLAGLGVNPAVSDWQHD